MQVANIEMDMVYLNFEGNESEVFDLPMQKNGIQMVGWETDTHEIRRYHILKAI